MLNYEKSLIELVCEQGIRATRMPLASLLSQDFSFDCDRWPQPGRKTFGAALQFGGRTCGY
jgi:hypothetical protein